MRTHLRRAQQDVDRDEPKSYVLHASGAGAPGQVRATVRIGLEPDDDRTTVTWSADAAVGGPVAGVGQRMMTGVARRMAGQFFAAVDDELSGAAVSAVDAELSGAAVVPISAAPAAEAAPAAAGEAPRVFPGRAPVAAGDVRSVLLGAAGGALITLAGVLVGYRLGRRSG